MLEHYAASDFKEGDLIVGGCVFNGRQAFYKWNDGWKWPARYKCRCDISYRAILNRRNTEFIGQFFTLNHDIERA